ncbi:MAG: Holliday junction branch migration protein RuvA [Deltaproteobacteria bacterium]|nr:Holliday junction branch migration protein RuvA [Deltaproteobacteria bacterium]
MIALLTGKLAAVGTDHVVIDVNGVGYHVQIAELTRAQLPAIGTALALHIHTHVREDQLALYGFASLAERALFQRLLGVANVGPKTALTVLSKLTPADLVRAVAAEDLAQLSAIPGIGKKTAERIVVDLKDRLIREHADLLTGVAGNGASARGANDEALSALCNLGYTRQAAQRALAASGATATTPLEGVIRLALRELARVS